ncbi:MAG: endonuclease III [Thermoflavifilum sp.]|nr:endonuclease III [Thermoflavifilum sp.]
MNAKEKAAFLTSYFEKHLPDAQTELQYANPYQLLVAVMLSAQCTDKRVNQVTPAFFRAFPDVYALAKAQFEDVFPYIKSISYPNSKTRHLIATARAIVEQHGGEIPREVEALMQLPGVGRKTANVLTAVLYEQPNMPVDTHVFRVSHRLGLVPASANTPLKVEQRLVKLFPPEKIHKAHHWLILHGRYICLARKPKCEICGLQQICSYYQRLQRKAVQLNRGTRASGNKSSKAS